MGLVHSPSCFGTLEFPLGELRIHFRISLRTHFVGGAFGRIGQAGCLLRHLVGPVV